MANTRELDASVDALSDVLDLIHLRGEGLAVLSSDGPADVRHQGGERLIHLVRRGSVRVATDQAELTLEAGDTALLATGVPHRVWSAEEAEWMSGRFAVNESAAGPLLGTLPAAIVVRAAELEVNWLPIAADLMAMEMGDASAGSRVMVSRLLDLAFIQALRAWSAGDGPAADPGWITAALDRSLGPAVRAIHRHPEHPWSVEELAEVAAMSRASFAARFAELMGTSPGRYLARLRLARAADQLATTTQAIGLIGKAVGYESEPAFSRAFAREYGMAPRVWRTEGRHQDVT